MDELSILLNRSIDSIQSKAKRLNLCKKSSLPWKPDEVEYLKRNYEYEDIDKIMSVLHRNYNSIIIKANRLGLKKIERNNKNMSTYTVNEDYFKNINTPNKAYYLGWAVTDGNIVYGKSNQYRLRLNSIDKNILEKFKADTMSTSKIYFRNNYAEINICNRNFVKNLFLYDFSNNKTQTIKFPKIDEIFCLDFIKGCFDGDGSYVCTDKTKKVSFVSASNCFIEEMIRILNKYGIRCYLSKRNTYSTFEISKKESLKIFLNLMLNTQSDFLDRKKSKMEKLLECI